MRQSFYLIFCYIYVAGDHIDLTKDDDANPASQATTGNNTTKLCGKGPQLPTRKTTRRRSVMSGSRVVSNYTVVRWHNDHAWARFTGGCTAKGYRIYTCTTCLEHNHGFSKFAKEEGRVVVTESDLTDHANSVG